MLKRIYSRPEMENYRYKIEVCGTVQGIGFRPFIYKEAVKRAITGHVFNHSSGVTIEAQGSEPILADFITAIRTSHPPFADIDSISFHKIDSSSEKGFKIVDSIPSGRPETIISPDIGTCDECLRDILSPENRRYMYPFTNCTNCGPRYTIIKGVPYDRPLTSMKDFKMCPDCEAEYKIPEDRRYHAQPNCCPVCGPRLELIPNKFFNPNFETPENSVEKNDPIHETVKLLNEGKIVAIKGIGGFHLACDATNESAVGRLRERKKRDEKPFALMMPDIRTVRKFCRLSDEEEKVLASPQRPIVLLKKIAAVEIAASVAPDNSFFGVMLPYTPLHHLLFTDGRLRALVMTSANLSDEPICFENGEAVSRLGKVADYFLTHNRDIHIRTDDSITRVSGGRPLMMRRARGYAPQPIRLAVRQTHGEHNTGSDLQSAILAIGAQLKNTVCLLKNEKAFLSHHIGDLENSASYDSFEQAINHICDIYDIKPTVIAHDMHPDYFSTQWAKAVHRAPLKFQFNNFARVGGPEGFSEDVTTPSGTGPARFKLVSIQHHHAHIASCMAENRVDEKVIGIALDGTGYGADGHIWGGEILIADYRGFVRAAQFKYAPMPGGEAAIKNPWQMALGYIFAALGSDIETSLVKMLVPAFAEIGDEKIELIRNMTVKSINTPLTSSCGRLFDAVAALLGLRQTVSYEGQAALELEMAAHKAAKTCESYPYRLQIDKDYITIDYNVTLNALLEDLKTVDKPVISAKFHNTVVKAIAETVRIISERTGIKKAALSGGCFQNLILLENLKYSLENEGITVYTHSLVPPNDGGIALGQAVIAGTLKL